MHLSFSPADADDIAELHVAPPPRAAPRVARAVSAPPPAGRYGEAHATNWPAIVAIVALHIGLFALLNSLGIVGPARRPPAPVLVTLVPDQIAPPPPMARAPPARPDRTPPPDAPPPIIATSAPSAAPILTVPPPAPAPAPVAAPAPAPIAVAPDPAPIIPPDVRAAQLGNPPPTYPMESRRRHEQGLVRLRVLVGIDGRVKQIEVARSSGFDRLDGAALDAVKRWRFQPGTQAGRPVEASGIVPIPFTLT